MYKSKEYYEDGYGYTVSHAAENWKSFSSDLYYLEKIYDPMYSHPYKEYYPIAPSGKYNARFGGLFAKVLKNMDYIGTYDGENFSIDVPQLYTSIQELDVLDVFTLEKSHLFKDGLINGKEFKVPKNTKLVVENFETIGYQITDTVVVSNFENGTIYKIKGDVKVNKVGKIKLERVFVEKICNETSNKIQSNNA
jgi:hypothetical protein